MFQPLTLAILCPGCPGNAGYGAYDDNDTPKNNLLFVVRDDVRLLPEPFDQAVLKDMKMGRVLAYEYVPWTVWSSLRKRLHFVLKVVRRHLLQDLCPLIPRDARQIRFFLTVFLLLEHA